MSLAYYYEHHMRSCPRCGGSVVRIKRRVRDRMMSTFFSTVHRFRCEGFGCSWEGNLKASPTSLRHEPSPGALSY
jgi:hypothetical protein